VTLFVTALNLCGLQGRSLSPDVFFYKGQTISKINENLGDQKRSVSDGMIAAVASLALLEVNARVYMSLFEELSLMFPSRFFRQLQTLQRFIWMVLSQW